MIEKVLSLIKINLVSQLEDDDGEIDLNNMEEGEEENEDNMILSENNNDT